MTFHVPQNLAEQFNSMETEEGGLPFPVPFAFWHNGKRELQAVAQAFPPQYYGGWLIEKSQMDEIATAGQLPIPPMLKVGEHSPRDSQETLPVYGSRRLLLAPICHRVSYTQKNRETGQKIRVFGNWPKGYSRHVQLLAMLMYPVNEADPAAGLAPWGPIVFTCRGYQAGNLLDALSEWKAILRPILTKMGATNVPTQLFAANIGSFGDTPERISVGQGDAKSPIVPIRLQPMGKDHLNEELVNRRYVGDAVVQAMGTYLEQAKPWMDAWTAKGRGSAIVEEDGQVPPAPSDEEFAGFERSEGPGNFGDDLF